MRKISESTVRRLSLYLRSLERFERDGVHTVSSGELAQGGATTAAQVRKDLSVFGSFGKRGLGYAVPELAARIRSILGLEDTWNVVLVGAGRIGSALLEHGDFRRRGFHIVAVIDADRDKAGRRWGGVAIRPDSELEKAIRDERVDIAILAVPAEVVQDVVDRVVRAGVRAILSFAPVQLRVPEEVVVKEVNMALELEALSFALKQALASETPGR